MNIKSYFTNPEKKQTATLIISFIITVAFATLNGFLGVFRHSIWNGSMCLYYLFLLAIKTVIIVVEKNVNSFNAEQKIIARKKTFFATSIILLVTSVSMAIPITLMMLNQKDFEIGLIPAIAVAVYTTYKITFSIINYKKNRRNQNLSFRQIQIINLIDAILSVLTLQNTLILVNGGFNSRTLIAVSALSSFAGLGIIITISITSFVRFLNENRKSIELSS